MADPAEALVPPREDFPAAALPMIFSDGVLNLSRAPGLVRFYLMRTDPELHGKATYLLQPVAQVAMPMVSFVQTYVFFELEMQKMVKDGLVSQSLIDQARTMQSEGEVKK